MPIADIDFEDYYPPERISELEEAFSRYDYSSTGSVSENKVRVLIREVTGVVLTPEQLAECLKEVDLNLNGNLEFEEFVVLVIKLLGSKPRANLINYKEYLDSQTVRTVKRLFARYDEDDSGSIDSSELQRICNELGRHPTPEQLAELVSEVDSDESGHIEFDEFCSLFAVLSERRKRMNYREFFGPAEVHQFRAVFKSFDTDGSGSVQVPELDQLFRRMGHALRKEQINAIVRDFDVDCSGSLEFDEFVVMLARMRGERRKRQINPDTCRAADLFWKEDFTVLELMQSGFTVEDLRAASVPATPIVQTRLGAAADHLTFTALELRRAGYSAAELQRSGLGPRMLRACGFSLQELRHAGFSAQALAEVNRALHAAFCRGDYSALPQLHPSFFRAGASPQLHRAVPRALTPTIRKHTDWTPKMSVNAGLAREPHVQRPVRGLKKSITHHHEDWPTDVGADNLRSALEAGVEKSAQHSRGERRRNSLGL